MRVRLPEPPLRQYLPDRHRALRLLLLAVIALVLLPFIIVLVSQVVPIFDTYQVLSDSMAPKMAAGDVVVVHNIAGSAVQQGDVITFHSPDSRETVTHEVVGVMEEDGQKVFQTRGINNEEPDPYVVPERAVIGTVVFTFPYLGYALQFLRSDVGIVLFVIVPVAGLILTEIRDLLRAKREATSEGEEES